MARVPLQQTPEVGLEIGSAPQFTGGSIEPVKDTVTDDIQRFSKAQRNVADIAIKLQAEYNDTEAKKLYNEYSVDLKESTDNYLTTEGFGAIETVDKDNGNTVYDVTLNNQNELLASYSDRASNDQIKYLFENMALVSTKAAHSKMTQHSIKQQRIAKEAESESKINVHKLNSISSITTFNDPNSDHWQNFFSGIEEIQQYAIDKNWNIDPARGDISFQYLEMVKEYTNDIHNAAVTWFKNENQEELGKRYFAKHAEGFESNGILISTVDGQTLIKSLNQLEKSQNEFCAEKICNNVLDYKGNSNDNNFLSQANFVLKLDSNNTTDDGNGSAVLDGNNANLSENLNATKDEVIEDLQQKRAESIYYNPSSTKYNQIIPQHATTHLFAIQKLGVKKADTLYSNAIKEANIDKERYNNDPNYFVEINKKVMENFNSLFLAEIENVYASDVKTMKEQLTKLQEKNSDMKSKGVYVEKKKNLKIKINELKEKIQIKNDQQYKYVNAIGNDLLVINDDIDYAYVNGKQYVEVNPVTNLPPLTYYEKQIKDTITDPVKQEHALTDLRFKYNKIDKQRTEIYNNAYTQAEDIAFSEPNGWKLLKANGIDINSFTLKDQENLKNGQPSVSNEDAIHEIETNDVEVLQNENLLKSYRYQLDPGTYEYYVNQLNGNKSNSTKSKGITVDKEIFEDGLRNNNLDNLVDAKSGSNDAKKYDRLKMKFRDRLNFYYENGIEITYDKRKAILKEILTDDVMFDKGFFGGTFGFDTKKKIYDYEEGSDDFKRLYIKVNDETIYLQEIPKNVRSTILRQLFISGEALSSENIANEWVNAGKPGDSDTYKKNIKINMMKGN